MKYDYIKAVAESARTFIANNIDCDEWERNELEEYLNDICYDAADVTGNECGTFTHNPETARAYVWENLDLLPEAATENGLKAMIDESNYDYDSERWDVRFRCLVLPVAISIVIKELTENGTLKPDTKPNDVKYGFTISIPEYTPTDFIVTENAKVFVRNSCLGFFRHEAFTNKPEEFKAHIMNMLSEHATIKPLSESKIERYEKLIQNYGK